MRIDIRRISSIKEGDEVVGNRTRVKVVKNKVAPPFREAEFDILYGKGISREGDLLDVAVNKNIIEKSGAWYSYANERIGQGRENARRFLIENAEIAQKIEAQVRKELGLAGPAASGNGANGKASPDSPEPPAEESGSKSSRSGPREVKVAGGGRRA
jgi:recombination protein RecA